jgi:antagonist of KipI
LNRIRVISPGLLTTVQDLGRPGYAHWGISASGAADALSLRVGNRLVGNPEGAAGLEMTLAGGTFEFESITVVSLTGGYFEASIPMWTGVALKPGEVVRCGHARSGARAYLCVAGGIAVPLVLGSASTHLLTGLGGWDGRALKRGDVLPVGATQGRIAAGRRMDPPPRQTVIRVTSVASAEPLCRPEWQVQEDSNRMGLRLHGPALAGHTGHMLTEGVPLGAVEVPPDGQPIILFVEHQTTGGYPKLANVISADFHAVGQLRPRDMVRFELVSIEAARALLLVQEGWLALGSNLGGPPSR